ncbi:MAG: VWA domain-containing protein, partial [Verrucomicrobiota bacterium]
MNEYETSVDRLGLDLLIAIDLSRSMVAEDVLPNRLEHSKNAILSFAQNRAGDRIGIIGFAGEARLLAPLTYDVTGIEFLLKHINETSLWRGGTNISSLIETASEIAAEKELDHKVLIIISDGEDLEGDAILAARSAHVESELSIFTVGVGTSAGAKVPYHRTYDRDGKPIQRGFVRNALWQEVISRFDESKLQQIANAGGGIYVPMGPDNSGLDTLYRAGLQPLAQSLDSKPVKDQTMLFQVPLGIALLILFLDFCWVERRRTLARPSPVAIPILLFAMLTTSLSANSTLSEAKSLLESGNATGAVEVLRRGLLKEPENPYLLYNYGLAAYQSKDYAIAQSAWEKLALHPDPKFSAKSMQQLGNLNFRKSEEIKHRNQNEALLHLENAKSSYQLAANIDRKIPGNDKNLKLTGRDLIKLYTARANRSLKNQTSDLRKAETVENVKRKQQIISSSISHARKAREDTERILGLSREFKTGDSTQWQKTLKERTQKLADNLFIRAEFQKESSPIRWDEAAQDRKAFDRQFREVDRTLAFYQEVLEVDAQHAGAVEKSTLIKKSGSDLLLQKATPYWQEGAFDGVDELDRKQLTTRIKRWESAMEYYQRAAEFHPEDQALRQEVGHKTMRLGQAHVSSGDLTFSDILRRKGKAPLRLSLTSLETVKKSWERAISLGVPMDAIRDKLAKLEPLLSQAYKEEGDFQFETALKTKDSSIPKAISQLENSIKNYE